MLLKHNKESALKDFISAYPSIIVRALLTFSVVKGFISIGMLDKRTLSWPDYDAILQTCKITLIKSAQEVLVRWKFQAMYKEMSRRGRLTDTFLQEIEFERDLDYNKNSVA